MGGVGSQPRRLCGDDRPVNAVRKPSKARRDHDELVRARATARALQAVLERPRANAGPQVLKLKQLSVGTNAGTWICDDLGLVQREGEPDGEWIERSLGLARMVKDGVAGLNYFPNGGEES